MRVKLDKVFLLVGLLGFFSIIAFGFLMDRPNRLASGPEIGFLTGASIYEIIIVITLWLFIIVASLSGNKHIKFLQGLFSIIILLTLMLSAGRIASEMRGEGDTLARVSLGASFWLSVFFVFVVVINATNRLKDNPILRYILIVCSLAVIIGTVLSGTLNDLSLLKEYYSEQDRFLDEFFTHLTLAFGSVGISIAIGVPLGILASKFKSLDKVVFPILNIMQTVPSLALFGILMAVLSSLNLAGLGAFPAMIALVLYSLLPIVRNTYTAFKTIDESVIEAAKGMGMTPVQLLYKIQVPLTASIVLNGVRISLVQVIGLTAIVTFIGAGGLGFFIFDGLRKTADDLILIGAIPIVLIAVTSDFIMQFVITITKPKGLREDI
jgi:osmoprotectant transport system permease protein